MARRRGPLRGHVDQRHLDVDTPERAYWHHGYQAALTDVLAMLRAPSEYTAARAFPTSALGAARMHPVAGRAQIVEELAFPLEGRLEFGR